MVGARNSFTLAPTLLNMKKVAGFPTNPPISSPKARLNPNTTQITLIIPIAIKL